MDLQTHIEELYAREATESGEEFFSTFDQFKLELNEGRIRAAEPDASSPTGWKVNSWVKKGILLGFRIGHTVDVGPANTQFRDKHTFPL